MPPGQKFDGNPMTFRFMQRFEHDAHSAATHLANDAASANSLQLHIVREALLENRSLFPLF